MNKEEIKKILPHREPMLLVDEVEHLGAAYAERMLHENPRRILSGEAGKERIA